MNRIYTSPAKVSTLILIVMSLSLAGCRSSRQTLSTPDVTPTADAKAKEARDYAEKVWEKRIKAQYVTANIDVQLNLNGRTISCDGKLRMKRNDVIQLSLTLPLIGSEVGRLECTPKDVLLVDRINRRYVRATYGDVAFLRQAGLDFNTLQAIFWNELFDPGEAPERAPLAPFIISSSEGHTLLALKNKPKLEYDFLTLTSTHKIDRLNVRSHNVADDGELTCIYGRFSKFSGSTFPTELTLRFKQQKRTSELHLTLSRLANADKWDTRTTLSSKYEARKAEDFLNLLSF